MARKIDALLGAALLGVLMLAAPARADKASDLENACYNSKKDVAVSVCTSAIEFATSHTALNLVYAQRGDAYTELGQYALAVKDYTQAIKLNPTFEAFYRDRGTAYFLMKQYQPSLHDFTEAIRLKSDNADAYYCRGLVEKKIGRDAEADADIQKAKEIDPYIEME